MTIQQMFFGSSGAASAKDINILFNGKWGTDSYGTVSAQQGASLATYWSSATQNNYTGQKANEYVQSDFTRVGDGILSFTLPAASYKIYARSGSGSGNNRWTGATATADLTLSSETPLLLLIPNHGSGNYGAGGGLFLIKGTDYTDSNNSAIFILGGGGGGYQAVTTYGAPGDLTTSTSTAGTRRGPSSGASGNYDHGAGWLDSYTVTPYSGQAGTQARHFVEGGKGGTSSACSTPGGFGGGGGGCPGGGGGYVGGYPGTDSHNGGTGYGGTGNSQYSGGGGGTSFYDINYIWVTSGSYGATNNSTLTSETQSDQGYFGIYTV